MQYNMLDIIREKDEKNLRSYLKESGKIEVLSESAQFLDKRSYLTIDTKGDIKRKKGNFALPVFSFLKTEDDYVEVLLNSCDIKERQNLDKIERYSNLDIEKVKLNYIKTLFNGNLEFSKRYGKELFLRDRETFFKISSNFALIGDDNIKPLMVLSLKELMKEYNENIFYIFISYMTKSRDNTAFYENAESYLGSVEELRSELFLNKELLESLEGLQILTSLALIDVVEVDNREKILGKLKAMIESKKLYTPLKNIEKRVLNVFL
ncbi:MAG: hypothetical protein IAA47_07245 [Candidatus Fusobacterium pullicola]|uniref:Uncharacterized protein n=1 Tax=Candidatus Fusobacterium pullicola TaxID=2838601 RepID=A0A9E2KZG9_9FUSO|nr:hypothetical protein [Candidatus Fusobacterium pullicola]